MNVNGIRKRKAELEEFINYAKPDLMLITEMKIDKRIQSSEFLPEDYIGNIWKDRTAHGGGVVIATRRGLDIAGLEVCGNTSESVWAKIMKDHPPIIAGCYYRRGTESSVLQVEEMEKVRSHTAETHNKGDNCTILLSSDFNVPDKDWEIPILNPGCHHKDMCDRLIEITSEHHLEQIQREPTRLNNILDLLFTNKSALFKEVSIMPGLSDHSTVLVDTYLNIKHNIKLLRKSTNGHALTGTR